VSRHFRPCYEFKTVIAKRRRYKYWYIRVPSGGRWASIYIGRDRPTEAAEDVARRCGWKYRAADRGLGTGDRQSLNRVKRWARRVGVRTGRRQRLNLR